ncbi:MAG TPA: hypothetical protein VFR33_10670 [Candidatus Dormibacteraeota bacterium]|nr:hypothetical protein [Candidatus Dormibacteraeota bacterium]
MLDAIVAFVVVTLVAAGVLVIIGPRNAWRRIRSLRRPDIMPLVEPRRPREVNALNPRTQRVVIAAGRLANWMRTHGHEDVARDIRASAARLNGNEAAGLYALQTTLRRMRVVNITDSAAHERLRALVTELRSALDDRFEQLELLPFNKKS